MAEGRHARRRQQRQRLLRRRRQRHGEGLARSSEPQQRLDGEFGIELRGRADHEDHRVVALVGQQALDGARHDLGLGAGQSEIDQLAVARRDSERLQPVHEVVGRACDIEAGHRHAVDHHGGAAAGRRRHRDAMAATPGLRSVDQQCRHVDQRFEHRHARDAMAAAEGVEGRVRPCDGAGMRTCQLLADVGASELVGDHRFARIVCPPRRAREPFAVAQRFHEQQDGFRLRIVHQQVGDLADREVDLVADRDQPRETDAARIRA